MGVVKLTEVMEKMRLENATPDVDVTKIRVKLPDINRPAIQLAGFFENFAQERIQICGLVEHSYMESMTRDEKEYVYNTFLSHKIPCVVFCRDIKPDALFLKYAKRHNVAVLTTTQETSVFMAELIRWLNVRLAPSISIHGVLVDVYGVGILITGESGIGKSEAALELIKRGHRLVSDDVVELRKVSEVSLVGRAPNITKHFIELRGIGIVDVKTMFGVASVRETQTIDLVVHLEEWDKNKEYDRLGMQDEYIEYLGNRVICHRIPIRPGRNLAIILEAAAINHRQKLMGYNAAQELYNRVQQSLMKKDEDDE